MFLNIILWILMECLHLFKAAKFGSLKMHVLCKVGKNIIFQNKAFLVMFYRQNKTFWSNFVILNIFWKQKIVKTVWPVRDTASQWSLLSLYLSWVTVGTRVPPLLVLTAKNLGIKEGKIGKKRGKEEKSGRQKSRRFFHFAPPDR